MLEREALRNMIQQWNANRLDLFELSEPNENLEFHGVMRFYFQDSGQKVATKCIRVASDATVSDVIETLIEKFRPDMRMLSLGSYTLWETHGPDDERRLEPHEKPLLVQLNWHADDREGRFLLKCTTTIEQGPLTSINEKGDQNFKRKLSKREKKELKKKEKLSRLKSDVNDENRPVAEKLYTELPETSFTRSISNPEAVMRRRRQQKLERKLQQFRSKDGGPDTGGTLKIYGTSLCPDVPYKTLLLSVGDTAAAVVREMLDKYGLSRHDPYQFCIVQVNATDNSEYILEDDECPLAVVMTHPQPSSIMFHVRRRPSDSQPRRRKKKTGSSTGSGGGSSGGSRASNNEPALLEVSPDGSPLENGRRIRITDVLEVGSGNGMALQLYGPSIQPRHCVVASTDGGSAYVVTPLHADAQVTLNGQRVVHTARLQHGCLLKFGRVSTFRFIDPAQENLLNRNLSQSQHFGSGSIYDRVGAARPGQEAILPAVLEFPEAGQAQFLAAVISRLDPHAPAFKLAPVYTLYLCARYRASTHYRPELTPTERAHKLTAFLHHVATLIHATVQERCADSAAQAFWMANASELLHFLKCDRHISSFSTQAQELLPTTVQNAFSNLVSCFQEELSPALGILTRPIGGDATEAVAPSLQALAAAMVLLRRCRVNAALTIQLFSHLFHYINAVCFNKLVSGGTGVTSSWGGALSARLALLGAWAERQGLELAADCHLARVHQAARLIQGEYRTVEEVRAALSACFKLNSVQVRALLTPVATPEIVEAAVAHARALADELYRADGREITLEESSWLGVGLLIPGDGFSAEVVRGVPPGLAEFVAPLQRGGLCRLTHQSHALGLWTVYMTGYGAATTRRQNEPRVHIIQLNKNSNGMGLSIVAAKGAGQSKLGIYIKSVVAGGAAAADGRLAAGDQLLSVDGHSLVGITQEKAAEYLVRTGPTVTLEVAKQGAVLHGLATLLHQPAYNQRQGPSGVSGGLRRASERDLPARLAAEPVKPAKSTPALHHHLPNHRWSSLRGSATGPRPQSTMVPTATLPEPVSTLDSTLHHQVHQGSTMSIRAAKLAEMSEEVTRRQQQQMQQYQQQKPPTILPHQHLQSPPLQHNAQNMSQPPNQQLMQMASQQNVLQHAPHQQTMLQQQPPHQQQQQLLHQSHQHPHTSMLQQQQSHSQMLQQQQILQQQQQQHAILQQQQQQHMSPQHIHMQNSPHPPHHMQSPPPQQMYQQQPQQQRYEWHQPQAGPPSPHKVQPPVAPKPQSVRRTEGELEESQPTIVPPEDEWYITSESMGSPRSAPHNPWQREEREREAEARRAIARARRDATIANLAALGSARSPQQNQQLRALLLERDFERRANQHNQEEGTGDSILDSAPLTTNVMEDDHVAQQPAPPKSILKTNARAHQDISNGYNNNDNVTSEESRVSTLTSGVNAMSVSESGPPPPPERGSSFAVMAGRTHALSPLSPPVTSAAPAPIPASATSSHNQGPPLRDKRVSFHERPPPAPPTSEPPPLNDEEDEDVEPISPPPMREDPDRFLSEASSMLSTSPGTPAATHTPGVIGAQEVYRDPRVRRLAEQQAARAPSAVPEQLSFKEKMKMFALESGEHSTPKDKVKISRAQRDIDAVH